MTDYELHREEWIAERAAIFEYEAGKTFTQALALAIDAWEEQEAAKTAQEAAK
jgi:hypothetical protein